MANEDLNSRIDTLAQWMHESEYLVVFTGAGISTDSGIPDFRGPDGVWTRRDKGLPPIEADKPWHANEPNPGHHAVTELQTIGKLKFLVSQNVDNMHMKAGIEFDRLAELHGNSTRVRCTECEETYWSSEERESCECGGESFKSSVVGFGDSMPHKDLSNSFMHAQKSDLFIVLGSSLVVTPAANVPVEALQAGAKLVIVNQGETPLDRYTHLRFDEGIGEVFPQAVERLKKLMTN